MLAAAATVKTGNAGKAPRGHMYHPPISLRGRAVPERIKIIARGQGKKTGPPVKGLVTRAAAQWVGELKNEALSESAKHRLSGTDEAKLEESARKKIRRSFEPPAAAKPGRLPNVTDEQLLIITDELTIAAALEQSDAITVEEFATRVESQASANKRPYKNKLSDREIANLVKRAARLQAEQRGVKLKTVGGSLTTEERQEAAHNVSEAKEFFKRFYDAIEGIPEAELKALLSWLDETPILAEGDKSKLARRVLTTERCQKEPELRRARATPVAREEGASMHSLLVRGVASKDMSRNGDRFFDVDLIAKGQFMQPRWFAKCEDGAFPLDVTEAEVNSVNTYMTPEGTMTAATWAKVLEAHGKEKRERLFDLGIDNRAPPFRHPLIVIFDACTAHGVKKGKLEITDAAVVAACKKYNIRAVLLNHNTSASPKGGDPLDAKSSANSHLKYIRRQLLKAVARVWSDPEARVVLPDNDTVIEAQKKHKKLSFVEQVIDDKEWWETVEDAVSRCDGLDRGASIRNTIMIALCALRSSPRVDVAWAKCLKDSGEFPPNDDVSALRSITARGKEFKDRFVEPRVCGELPRAFRAISDVISPFLERQRTGVEPHSPLELQDAMSAVANIVLGVRSNPTCNQACRALQVFRSPRTKKHAAAMSKNLSVSLDPETGREVRTAVELAEAQHKAKEGPKVCKHKACDCCERHCDEVKPHKTEMSKYCTSSARLRWLASQGAKAKVMEWTHTAEAQATGAGAMAVEAGATAEVTA